MKPWDIDEQFDRSRPRKKDPERARSRHETEDEEYEDSHPRRRSHRRRTHKDDFWDDIR